MNRKALAFHEAGHAVVARLLSIQIIEATISPRPEVFIGNVETQPAASWARGKEAICRALERDIQVSCAGEIAQKIYRPQSLRPHQARQDCENMFMAAATYSRLNRFLTGSIDALVERLRKQTVRLVRENWPKVERVAAALLERGELTQAEIDAAMAGRRIDRGEPQDARDLA